MRTLAPSPADTAEAAGADVDGADADGAVQLVLVRHALPVRIDAVPGGPPADPGLSPRGHRQADIVGHVLSQEPVSGLYSSPSLRARQTAAPLCHRLAREPVIETALAEWDSTSASYVPVEEMREGHDPRWEALRRGETYDPGFDYAPYRESVVAGIDRIAAAHGDGGTVVLFTHAGVVNAYLGHVLGQRKPFWLPLPSSPYYASVSRLVVVGTDAWVVSVNETSHLLEGTSRERP